MHIHGHQMVFSMANPYSAAADNQRKADVRRKLMSSASDIEGIASPDEAKSVGKLMNGRHGESFEDDEYRGGSSTQGSGQNSGQGSDFG